MSQSKGFATREAALMDALTRVVNFRDSFVVYRDTNSPRRFLVVSEERWRMSSKKNVRYLLEYIAHADASFDEVN